MAEESVINQSLKYLICCKSLPSCDAHFINCSKYDTAVLRAPINQKEIFSHKS